MLATLLDALSDQSILIVLDNCEHLIDACATLADRISRGCPGVNLVATSREPLGIDGEDASTGYPPCPSLPRGPRRWRSSVPPMR